MLSAVMFFALFGSSVAAGFVQTPELASCPSDKKIDISNVTIWNAEIGEIMTTNFTLITSQNLRPDLKLEVKILTSGGKEIRCYGTIGSCAYSLCGGSSRVEQLLGQPWDNKCPVPEITAPVSHSVLLHSFIQMAIEKAPTTVTIKLKATEGEAVIGCTLLKVYIGVAGSNRLEEA
ncbi:uncharacterized protein LOC144103690 [Amblyomma americanum]